MAKLEVDLAADDEQLVNRLAHSLGMTPEEYVGKRLLPLLRVSAIDIDAGHNSDSHRPIWEIACELGQQISEEDRKLIPRDLSINIDHYLYGSPKVED